MTNNQLNIDTSELDFLLHDEQLEGVILATHQIGSGNQATISNCFFCR